MDLNREWRRIVFVARWTLVILAVAAAIDVIYRHA